MILPDDCETDPSQSVDDSDDVLFPEDVADESLELEEDPVDPLQQEDELNPQQPEQPRFKVKFNHEEQEIGVPYTEFTDEYPFLVGKAGEFDVIVMTQACDLENGKVDQISLCTVLPIDLVLRTLYQANTGAELDLSRSKHIKACEKILDQLKKGQHINYHLINQHVSDNIPMEHKVVYLKKTYTMPVKSAENLLKYEDSKNTLRLRLSPPYREHLAQSYAGVFGRIGLPIDINTKEIGIA